MKKLTLFTLAALIIGMGLFQSPARAVNNFQQEGERRQLPSGPYIPGHLIVKLRPDVNAQDAQSLRAAAGATVARRYPLTGAELWRMGATAAEQAQQRFENDPRFEYIERDYIIRLDQATPNDPSFSQMWALNNTGQTGGTTDADIDAPEAWGITTGSSSVLVAVIDSGVQVATTQALAPGCVESVATHPDLSTNLWNNPGETPGDGIDNDGNGFIDDVHGWNFFDDAAGLFCHPAEDFHGTHVAGTIGARGNNSLGVTGVNWQVQIMILKFLAGAAGGSTADAIAAIQYAKNEGAQIINASWGGTQFSQALKDAVEACNCLFVAAAGNGGEDQIGDNNDSVPTYPASFNSSNVIAVANTDHNDNLASGSNFGAVSVDLCAPGSSILSTLPTSSYGNASGTSMAAPHVSGVAGLVRAQSPGLTPAQVKQRILDGVDAAPACNGKTVTGGRLNARKALADPVNTCTPPPSGNWTIPAGQSCTLSQNATVTGNVVVEQNATLTVASGVTLDINFSSNHLRIRTGAKVVIQDGGKIQ